MSDADALMGKAIQGRIQISFFTESFQIGAGRMGLKLRTLTSWRIDQ